MNFVTIVEIFLAHSFDKGNHLESKCDATIELKIDALKNTGKSEPLSLSIRLLMEAMAEKESVAKSAEV